MRIGALASETSVSERLLRYYEEQGLLKPARKANGYREYSDSDVVAVTHIRSLLAAGLPTAVIAEVLPCWHDEAGRMTAAACPGMVDHLNRERARIADAISDLATAQRALDSLLAAIPGHTSASASTSASSSSTRPSATRQRRVQPIALAKRAS